jgi:hypothetical protein
LQGEEINPLLRGGPSLLLPHFSILKKFNVSIYEKTKTLGRKFVVGKGGFNPF